MDIHKLSSLTDVQNCIAEHQKNTFTHFVSYNRSKRFGNEDYIPNACQGRMHFWSQAGKLGVPIDYDGVPFMHVGRWSLICHQGRDVGLKTKMKYIERKKKLEQNNQLSISTRRSSTKKVNCPASIYVSHIVKFPQFIVPTKLLLNNSLPTEQVRRTIKEKIRLQYKYSVSRVLRVHCYYMRLSRPEDHQGHPFVAPADYSALRPNMVVSNPSTLDRRKINRNRDKHRRTREPMDEAVVNKLMELVRAGYCSTTAIRAELSKYVIKVLFEGRAPPPAMFRRYNPTSRDIQNAFLKVKQEALAYRCTELKNLCHHEIQTINGVISTMEDEATLSNLYRQLKHVTRQLETGGELHEVGCSVSVQQVHPDENTADVHVVTLIEERPPSDINVHIGNPEMIVENVGCDKQRLNAMGNACNINSVDKMPLQTDGKSRSLLTTSCECCISDLKSTSSVSNSGTSLQVSDVVGLFNVMNRHSTSGHNNTYILGTSSASNINSCSVNSVGLHL